VVSIDGLNFINGPHVVLKVRRFLPAGPFEQDGELVVRKRSLIQIYTDPGGMRTLAVADIRLKDPGRAKK
jgi:hypothetical protein